MNLQELIKKSTVTKLTINVNGNEGDIFVRPLMAGDKIELLKTVTKLLQLKTKIDKVKEAQEKAIEISKKTGKKLKIIDDYQPSGDEIADSSEYKMIQAFYLVCKENGQREYTTYKEMSNSVPNEIMDAICAAIDEHLIPEDVDEIEGN